jgi:hypothetical protein
VASDICLASLLAFLSSPDHVRLSEDLLDTEPSPLLETVLSLKEFLFRRPMNFTSDTSLSALRGKS